ncbi:hypothetical protein KP509_29G063600 [Ceratopteris richardii]|uniref:Uncharacterized protein n=1 Tax=Ceratopteris richardii TaxID=49495 RepID=A0A8T2R8J1_CERRI|nr:hypothetical protein KP509_29G063600 [Ceratopteris richardii]
MASGGLPNQPLPATFMAQLAKNYSFGHSNVGLSDNRGPAPPPGLPSASIHPSHILPDERDAFISWIRGEFAAANAIIDAMCQHLRAIGEPSEYESLFACIHRRRSNWAVVLNMQQFFPVAEVVHALQQATFQKQQAHNNFNNEPYRLYRNKEDLNDPRNINLLRGLKEEALNVIPQTEISVADVSAALSSDPPLSNLSMSEEVTKGKSIQSPASRTNKLDTSQRLSKVAIDSIEQSTNKVPPNPTVTKSLEGRENITGSKSKTSSTYIKPPGSSSGKLFSTDFTTLSKQEQDARLPMIKVSKHFQCWEPVEGSLVNVAEGLELYENVLNTHEASQVAALISELQSAGKRGELDEDRMDSMPLVFSSLIDRLILWQILPPSKRPNYCSIEVLEEGEDCLPYLSYQHVDQYFCCLFLMAESTIVFGHKLLSDGGDHKSHFRLLLPSGSVLVVQGNSAGIANRTIIPSPRKRIMVTFTKLLHNKATNVIQSCGPFTLEQLSMPNSLFTSTSAVAAPVWPPIGLPGGRPGVQGSMPAMMKHISIARPSGMLPMPSFRPVPRVPHPIPQHLVTPGNMQGIVPTGTARMVPPVVFSPAGWQPVPSQVPPRLPNTGTGVFFPSSASDGGSNVGRSQTESGIVTLSPPSAKSETFVASSSAVFSSERQQNTSPKSTTSMVQDEKVKEKGDPSAFASSKAGNETSAVRKNTKESAHADLKLVANSNTTIKEDQQHRAFHISNKASGSKS